MASEITGGSAAMYAPGIVLKTGGPTILPGGLSTSDSATNRAERIDLSVIVTSGDYGGVPDDLPNAAPMNHARHFHNLVVLPNGNVLAVGGNSFSNALTGENPNHPCEFEGQRIDTIPCKTGCPSVCVDLGSYHDGYSGLECGVRPENFGCSLLSLVPCNTDLECTNILAGATCSLPEGRCSKPCTTNTECGTLAGQCDPGQLLSPLTGACNPGNNACYATRQAEMYDPTCDTWADLDAQEFPRMYHSSALLVPDGRVLSMGGGHRQAADFEPRFTPSNGGYTVNGPGEPGLAPPGSRSEEGAPARRRCICTG